MRPLILTLLLTSSAHATPLQDIQQAQTHITAYLPHLTSQSIAQALKDAANKGLRLTIIAPQHTHHQNDSYLLSLLLASKQTPPAPIHSYQKTIQAPPFLIIDARTLWLGPGTQGPGSASPGNPKQLASAFTLTGKISQTSKPVDVTQLIREKYGLKQ